MDLIRRFLGNRSASRATASEVDVLGSIVGESDPRLRLVREQLVRAPEVARENPSADTFRVRPTSTFDDITFQLETHRIESEPIRVTDAGSGRDLEFRVVIGRHGFLNGLEGRTIDGGPWPTDWSVGSMQRVDDRPHITLASAEETAAFQASAREHLAAWIGTEIDSRIELTPPASDAALASRERAVGGKFTLGYRTFLRTTDGLARRAMAIHGHHDAHRVDNPHMPALLIAYDADDRDEFVVVISLAGDDERVYRVDIHDPDEKPQPIATSFADYVRAVAQAAAH